MANSMKSLVCRVIGHDEITLQVGSPESGGGALHTCLRCRVVLNKEEWEGVKDSITTREWPVVFLTTDEVLELIEEMSGE